jgi:hypothetical protein
MVKKNLLTKALDKLVQPDSDLTAQELSQAASDSGSTLIQDLPRGQFVKITGVISSATTRPQKSVPAYEIEIYDGSGTINAIWLGRAQVVGVVPGGYIEVQGRITFLSSNPTIYNPYYTLLRRDDE